MLLIDHNFDERLLRRLWGRIPELEIVLAREAGLAAATDEKLLQQALDRGWTVLTHDASTIPPLLDALLRSNRPTPRVVVVRTGALQSAVVDDLEVVLVCSMPRDWEYGTIWMPL